MPNSTGPLRFGGNNVWGEWFKGQLDELRLYSRALTPAEIQTDMATPVSGAGVRTALAAAKKAKAQSKKAASRKKAKKPARRHTVARKKYPKHKRPR
jgi:hypothetical protein